MARNASGKLGFRVEVKRTSDGISSVRHRFFMYLCEKRMDLLSGSSKIQDHYLTYRKKGGIQSEDSMLAEEPQ